MHGGARPVQVKKGAARRSSLARDVGQEELPEMLAG